MHKARVKKRSVEFSKRGGGLAIFDNSCWLKNVFYSKLPKQQVIASNKVIPLFYRKNYGNNKSKIKSYPLFFNENYKNNESKMVYPQKQGEGGGGQALVENSTKKWGF